MQCTTTRTTFLMALFIQDNMLLLEKQCFTSYLYGYYPTSLINFSSRPIDHYFRRVCLFVCLCRVFLSRLWSDLDQTRIHVTCLGL